MPKPDILSQIERDEELCIKDGQEPSQTRVGDGQEPPQTPEETDQKEEALGEDKVPMEADTGESRGCQEDLLPWAIPVPAPSGGLLAVSVGEGMAGHPA